MASSSAKQRRKRRQQGGRSRPPQGDGGERRERPQRGEPADRPQPPWGSFPLSELAIFVGAVMLLVGFFAASGSRQATLLVTGFVVASLGALEVAVREHLAGYRSHTLLLAGVPSVVALGLLFYLGPDALTPPVRVAIGGAVYAGSAWILVEVFRARSGGRAFRLKAPRRR